MVHAFNSVLLINFIITLLINAKDVLAVVKLVCSALLPVLVVSPITIYKIHNVSAHVVKDILSTKIYL